MAKLLKGRNLCRASIVTLLALAGLPAQVVVAQGQPQGQPQVQVQTTTTPPPQAQPRAQWHSIVKRDANGRTIRIDEALDFVATGKNHLITQADRERMAAAVKEWKDEIDQLAIDNLDFMEMIDRPDGKPGLLDNPDPNDTQMLHRAGQVLTMLTAVGQMTVFAQQRGVMTPQQAGVNQQIINEYLQAVMNDIVAEHASDDPRKAAEAQLNQAKAITGFLFYMSCRDTLEAYRRLLADAAPVAEKALEALSLPAEVLSKARPLAQVAVAAKDKPAAERRAATRKLLDALEFEQRRAFLFKARELNPEPNPLASLPPVPPPPGS